MNAMWCGVEAGTLASHKPTGRIARVGDDANPVKSVPEGQIPITFIDWPRESQAVKPAEIDLIDLV